MKTIAICNHKGGVGKTALSMAIAEGLHRKGKRTLLVDLDQQMNATQQAKIDTTDEVTVYDLLTSFDYTAKDGIKHFDGGDIIPGDVLVSNAESDMAKLDTRLTMLADAMEGIDDDYDYAIIDCPPSLGLVTRNAMVAADELIVPVIPNRSSLKGFTNIQKCVNSVRRNKRLNPNLRIAGIVVNMFDGRTSLSRGVVNELPSIARAANTKMFHTIIRKCEAVNKAQSAKRLWEGTGAQAKHKRASWVREMDEAWNLTQLEKGKKNSKIRDRQPRDIEKEIVDRGEYSYKNNLRELIHLAINEGHPKNMEQFKKLLASWGVDIFIKNNRVYATDLDIKEAGNPKCTFNLTRLDGRFALKSLQTVFETGTTESEKPMTYEQRRDVFIQRLKKAYSAWVEQAKASKGVSYNAFPKFVAPKCDEDLLEDPAVRDELLARRGYAKEIRNRYASAVPDYGEDNVRAAGQAGTHSVQHPVIESGRTREQSDRNVEH